MLIMPWRQWATNTQRRAMPLHGIKRHSLLPTKEGSTKLLVFGTLVSNQWNKSTVMMMAVKKTKKQCKMQRNGYKWQSFTGLWRMVFFMGIEM